MSVSKAKRTRNKLMRESNRNPELNRGSWSGVNPLQRVTPSLVEKKRRDEKKHKPNYLRSKEDGSAYLFLEFIK